MDFTNGIMTTENLRKESDSTPFLSKYNDVKSLADLEKLSNGLAVRFKCYSDLFQYRFSSLESTYIRSFLKDVLFDDPDNNFEGTVQIDIYQELCKLTNEYIRQQLENDSPNEEDTNEKKHNYDNAFDLAHEGISDITKLDIELCLKLYINEDNRTNTYNLSFVTVQSKEVKSFAKDMFNKKSTDPKIKNIVENMSFAKIYGHVCTVSFDEVKRELSDYKIPESHLKWK